MYVYELWHTNSFMAATTQNCYIICRIAVWNKSVTLPAFRVASFWYARHVDQSLVTSHCGKFLCRSCWITWPPKMQVAKHWYVCMRLHHVTLQMMIIVRPPWVCQLGQPRCVCWPAIFVLLVCLLQVNITLLQASVVEEMISFSALDNIRDLTCVSLFAVCFDAITARFCCSNQVSSL